jgi:hypothetical protein
VPKSGAAFRSRATLKAADFEWVQGERCVTFYESSPGNHWGFCRVCGSPIVSKFDARPNYLGLPLGALDDDPGIGPKVRMYVASKAPWFTITDDLPPIPGEASASGGWRSISRRLPGAETAVKKAPAALRCRGLVCTQPIQVEGQGSAAFKKRIARLRQLMPPQLGG